MTFSVEYFYERVLAEIESWPVDVLADYARIVELLMEHGPNLKLPYSRAFGDGLFELRPRGRRASAAHSIVFSWDGASSCCMPSSRSRSKRPTAKSRSPASD
jgi:hypothetical protein